MPSDSTQSMYKINIVNSCPDKSVVRSSIAEQKLQACTEVAVLTLWMSVVLCTEIVWHSLGCHCVSTVLIWSIYGAYTECYLFYCTGSYSDCTELSRQPLHSEAASTASIGICMT